jgi:hypothetical protein
VITDKQVALLPEPAEMTPMQMLQIAVQRGVDTEQLKQLMELQREWKAEKAREAFLVAMNAFRAESIKIVKDKAVAFGNTAYKHATLAKIVEAITPKLSEHGLSHRWETKQDGNAITVRCIITHALGHSADTSLTASPDNSGGKNSIQAVGSTVSYLQRYTILALTGLAAADQDTDAQVAALDRISESQVAALEALIAEVGADKARFLKAMSYPSLEAIPAKSYDTCVAALNRKRAKR